MSKLTDTVKEFLASDVVERAVKTFVQAFLAALLISYQSVDSLETAKAVAVGALAAGVSAVWNSLRSK